MAPGQIKCVADSKAPGLDVEQDIEARKLLAAHGHHHRRGTPAPISMGEGVPFELCQGVSYQLCAYTRCSHKISYGT